MWVLKRLIERSTPIDVRPIHRKIDLLEISEMIQNESRMMSLMGQIELN